MGEMNCLNKKRIDFVDSLKGFLIILVVLGHVADGYLYSGSFLNNSGLLKSIYNVIYIFHMPLFVLVSGYLFEYSYFNSDDKKKKTKTRYLIQMINLIFVYLLFSIVYAIFKIALVSNVNNTVALEDVLSIPIKAIPPFWYLYILVLYYFVFLFMRRLDLSLMLWVSFFISLWSPYVSAALPFELKRACYYCFFFSLGIALKKNPKLLLFEKRISILMFIVGLFLVVQFWNNYHYQFICHIDFINMIVAVCVIPIIWNGFNSNFLKKNKVFGFMGKYTLEIFVMHIPVISVVRAILINLSLPNIFLDIFLGLLLGLLIPIIVTFILKKVKMRDLLFKPFIFIIKKELYEEMSAKLYILGLCLISIITISSLIFVNLVCGVKGLDYSGVTIYSKVISNTPDIVINRLGKNRTIIMGLSIMALLLFEVIIIWLIRKVRYFKKIYCLLVAIILLVFFINLGYSFGSSKSTLFYKNSDYIENNYINPYNVNVESVDADRGLKAHNLVYIVTRNSEVDKNKINLLFDSYKLDVIDGMKLVDGQFDENIIFSVNFGIPINIGVFQGNIRTHSKFYGSACGMGELLKRQGYSNYILFNNVNKWETYDKMFSGHCFEVRQTDSFEEAISSSYMDAPDTLYNVQIIDDKIDCDGINKIKECINNCWGLNNTTLAITVINDNNTASSFIINSVYDSKIENRNYNIFDMFPTLYASINKNNNVGKLAIGKNCYSYQNKDDEIDVSKLEGYSSGLLRSMYNSSIDIETIDALSRNSNLYFEHSNDGRVKVCLDVDTDIINSREFGCFVAEIWDNEKKEKEVYLKDYNNSQKTFKSELIKFGNENKDIYLYIELKNRLRYKFYGEESINHQEYCSSFLRFINRFSSNQSIIISVKDEAAAAMSDHEILALSRLRLNKPLWHAFRQGYIAVIISEKVKYESLGFGELSYSCDLPGGSKCNIISAGYEDGNVSSIMIDDKEYSLNKRGINIVVYDNLKQKVICSTTYDTSDGIGYYYKYY